MIKLRIMYGELFNTEWQEKSFKDEITAIGWCRRNYKKIGCINDYRTNFQPISHFDIMDAIRGVQN